MTPASGAFDVFCRCIICTRNFCRCILELFKVENVGCTRAVSATEMLSRARDETVSLEGFQVMRQRPHRDTAFISQKLLRRPAFPVLIGSVGKRDQNQLAASSQARVARVHHR